MTAEEQPLVGNVTTGVVRVGETVRRPSGFWTDSVDELLLHLERVGFTGAPRALGRDEHGRQVLEYIDGDVGGPDIRYSDDQLRGIASLLRALHDAVSDFPTRASHRWNALLPHPASAGKAIVCHNDAAPWNLVERADGTWALIDWDGAAPGSRAWELAYTAQTAVPLVPEGVLGSSLERLEDFLVAYGPAAELEELPAALAARPQAMADMLHDAFLAGNQPWARIHVEDGAFWAAVAEHLRQQRVPLTDTVRAARHRAAGEPVQPRRSPIES